MRFLIEAHHPAHVHFWKFPVRELRRRGHEVLLIGRDRDVMRRLLEVYDWIPAEIPPRRSGGNRFPFGEMLRRQRVVARAIRRFRPDVAASLMGSYTQSAKWLGVRNVVFTDSEFQRFNHRIAHPFADEIHTPECFYKDLGRKHRRYRGFHELSFLHRERFRPDPEVVSRYDGLRPGEYVVFRLSAWNTLHDVRQRGMGEHAVDLVLRASERHRVVVSAEESGMPDALRPFRSPVAPEDFHHVLGHAALVVTEGASTASEAACLGTPCVYVNSTEPRGYLNMLESDYGLVECFRDGDAGARRARQRIDGLGAEADVDRASRAARLHDDFPDVAAVVAGILEGGRTGEWRS